MSSVAVKQHCDVDERDLGRDAALVLGELHSLNHVSGGVEG